MTRPPDPNEETTAIVDTGAPQVLAQSGLCRRGASPGGLGVALQQCLGSAHDHAGNDRHPLCRRATARSLLGRKVRRGVP